MQVEGRVRRSFLALLLVLCPSCGAAWAGESTPAGDVTGTPESGSASALGIQGAPLPENGLAVGGFLVYPSIFVGAIYNDNLFTSENNRVDGLGIQVVPNISAVDDQGIHKTTLTLNADGTLYPNASRPALTNASSPNNVTGTASVDHVWSPSRDLSIDINGGVTRQFGVFGTIGAVGSSFVSSPNSSIAAGVNQNWNQVYGGLSVQKNFTDRFYVRAGVGAQDTLYESLPYGGSSLSGVNYDAFIRAGYWVIPQVSAFLEGDGNWSEYRDSWYNSNSYRLIGGLSSQLISLFRGEIYAGYQDLISPDGLFGSVVKPAYGATIYYYPTQYVVLSASAQNSVGSAAYPGQLVAGSPYGATTQARFQATYAMAKYWSLNAIAGWGDTTWSNSPLKETAWTFGGSLSYNYWRNVALTLNYQYTATSANRAYVSVYTQNMVSAGLTYRY